MNNPGMQIDLSKATDVVCECGSKLFREVCAMKTLSALVSPNGQETLIPMKLYACIKCDAIPAKIQEDLDGLS